MPIPEGKIFSFKDKNHIKNDFLETIDYDGLVQEINYTTKEFTAVCPFSGLPDIATVEIVYIPNKHIVELKSLKYYFISFRDVGIYQEEATNKIFNDLFSLLKPKTLKVKTIYNTRGGIDAICVIDSEKL
jgi:7-cyano-7-deazaguanine reductase